jgi:amino acid transporter
MGIMGPMLYVWFAVYTAPNADIPLTTFLGLAIVLMVGFVYWMFSTSMPRTGGDYVWVSRVLHPYLGFLESSMILFVMISSFVAYDIVLAVQYGFAYMFINFGTIAKDAGLVNLGTTLMSDKMWLLGVSLAISALVIAVMLLPIKRVVNVLVGSFFVMLAIFAVYLGLLFTTGHAGFVNNFNATSGTTYDAILNTATPGAFAYTLDGTLFLGLIFVMLSYIGLVNSSYFAGEVSGNPFKSQGIAIFGSPLIYGAFLFTIYFSQFMVYGHDFLAAAANPGYGLLPGGGNPSGLFLVNYLTTNPWISALVAFGMGLQLVVWSMAFYLAPTRYIFSWSFDRILPLGLSKTSKKGVPYFAVLLYGLVTVVFVFLTIFTTIGAFYIYAIFGFYFSTTIVMIAGALFPFRRKEIFESSHRYVKARIGGVPVITIVGLVGAIFTAITMISAVLPAYTHQAQFDFVAFSPIIIMLIFATFVYWGSYYYQKGHGLPVELVGKQIPPL